MLIKLTIVIRNIKFYNLNHWSILAVQIFYDSALGDVCGRCNSGW